MLYRAQNVGYIGVVLVFLGLAALGWFMKWYQAHPVMGKFVLGILLFWGIWHLIRGCHRLYYIIKSAFGDPYTRTKKEEDN